MKIKLLGKNLEELKKLVAEEGLPGFTAKQIAQWLYVKKVRTIDEMTNLSKAARAALSEKYEVGVTPYAGLQVSSDGTKKYLFPVRCTHKRGLGLNVSEEELEAGAIEAVMIPDDDRATLCVSSQSGCRMGCKFCMTGRQGFHGHMSAADIISQFIAVDESDRLTNAVFMGMGEPLDNYDNVMRAIEILTADWGFAWSPKRITVSSIGKLDTLRRLLDETSVHVAISVHSPYHEERLSLMPVEKPYPVRDVMKCLRQYDFAHQRRLSVEYIMWSGLNDDDTHAQALVDLLAGSNSRVNLIRFHAIPGVNLKTTDEQRMVAFRDYLNKKGVIATIRRSRGEDIFAACGMLAGKVKKK